MQRELESERDKLLIWQVCLTACFYIALNRELMLIIGNEEDEYMPQLMCELHML